MLHVGSKLFKVSFLFIECCSLFCGSPHNQSVYFYLQLFKIIPLKSRHFGRNFSPPVLVSQLGPSTFSNQAYDHTVTRAVETTLHP